MKPLIFIFLMTLPCFIYGNSTLTIITANEEKEEQRLGFLIDVIALNLKPNGWSNFICAGHDFPNYFYVKMKKLPLTFTNMSPGSKNIGIDGVVPYHSNMLILHCMDFEAFEEALLKAISSPYWHPYTNTILYYHSKEKKDIPKIFMIFWFYKICDGIVIQYNDDEDNLIVSLYNPYVGENFKLSHQYGCWKTTKSDKVMQSFQKSFTCVEGCHNITLHSKLRALFLGTCIGYDSMKIRYGDLDTLRKLNLFEDKSHNLHGYVMKGHGADAWPFLIIDDLGNGQYALRERDGMIWNTAAERMNFSINFDSSRDVLKKPFDFNINLQQIYSFSKRQADVVVFPVYQFDFVIIDVDLSTAYKDSGVCIVSHRAGFETVLFDSKLLVENTRLVMEFSLCFLSIWLLFFVYNTLEMGKFSLDQAGKDFMNTIRNVLSIGLHKPLKRSSFRVYLVVSMWSFFIINFATQAAIISFFAAYKRGKEVETFEDVIETGYVVEGLASPDMVLPDDEERFVTFNSRVVPVPTMFGCIEQMSNNSQRFCLLDCSVGRYLARNRLNEKGEQYLHIAKDRIHSHYLNMMLHRHSPLTRTFNRYLRMVFEAGLIQKWEQYRFSDIGDEVAVKALSLEDLIGIFKCYYIVLGISSLVFLVEISFVCIKRLRIIFQEKIRKWKITRIAKKKIKHERKLEKVRHVDTFTQTA